METVKFLIVESLVLLLLGSTLFFSGHRLTVLGKALFGTMMGGTIVMMAGNILKNMYLWWTGWGILTIAILLSLYTCIFLFSRIFRSS